METNEFQMLIPPSQSDRLLNAWGYDLVREYFTIAELIPLSPHPVIELATGSGRMCAVLSCHHSFIISGDITVDDLPRARQRIPPLQAERVRFLRLTMEQLPFRSGSVASLICMNTLHETTHPHRCMDEMIRVMRPDGVMVVGDFNRTGFAVMQKIHEIVYHNNHPEGFITSDDIQQRIDKTFRSVRLVETPLNHTIIATGKQSFSKEKTIGHLFRN